MMNKLFIILILFYSYAVSPLLHGLSSVLGVQNAGCRFKVTCSQYALESFKQFHFWEALKRTVVRLGQCHPWGRED